MRLKGHPKRGRRGIDTIGEKLRRCNTCGIHTPKDICPHCGSDTVLLEVDEKYRLVRTIKCTGCGEELGHFVAKSEQEIETVRGLKDRILCFDCSDYS